MPSTIMVVDDNIDYLAVIKKDSDKKRRLSKVITAEGGETALDLPRKNLVIPTLIFLDLKMPGVGGIKTVR